MLFAKHAMRADTAVTWSALGASREACQDHIRRAACKEELAGITFSFICLQCTVHPLLHQEQGGNGVCVADPIRLP